MAPAVAFAQADSTRRDTTAVRDTSASRDTTAARDTTPALLPTFPATIVPGPLPKGARYTFTVDTMLLSTARTLSDLLAHIPGVYVARGGWYGQAETVLYGGRGAAALEIYWDGVPIVPLGRDSVWLDPARISLAPLERVDVLILPAALQVYLVTSRHRSTEPKTQVGILTGQQDIAEYRAGYTVRTRSGVGVALVADWASIGSGLQGSSTTPFGTSDLWLKADYVPPGGRMGASFQLVASSWHRQEGAGVVNGWLQDRRDRVLSVFLADREDGLGWRLTGTLATSGISHDTAVAPRTVSTAIVEVSRAWPTMTLAGTARFGAGGLPQQFEARAGWMPVSPITLSGEVRQSFYSFDRRGAQAYGMAGLALPLGFSARADVAWRKDAQAAFMATRLVTQQVDVAGWLRLDHPRLMIEVGRGRRDPFAPFGFAAGVKTVDSMSATPLTEFLAVRASVTVVPGLTLSGWYFDPIVGGGDFEPPRHARVSATFYSKFWRVFKSGIFALRGEIAMESWSRSPLGGLQAGAQRPLTGSSFVDGNIEMQLAGVTLFWNVQNFNIMRSSFVDGLSYPRSIQSYGARWFFTN